MNFIYLCELHLWVQQICTCIIENIERWCISIETASCTSLIGTKQARVCMNINSFCFWQIDICTSLTSHQHPFCMARTSSVCCPRGLTSFLHGTVTSPEIFFKILSFRYQEDRSPLVGLCKIISLWRKRIRGKSMASNPIFKWAGYGLLFLVMKICLFGDCYTTSALLCADGLSDFVELHSLGQCIVLHVWFCPEKLSTINPKLVGWSSQLQPNTSVVFL